MFKKILSDNGTNTMEHCVKDQFASIKDKVQSKCVSEKTDKPEFDTNTSELLNHDINLQANHRFPLGTSEGF